MNIAYLILAHQDPAQLRNLILALDEDNVVFFIHIDKKSVIKDFYMPEIIKENVIFIDKRINVYWAGYSIVKATISIINAAVNHAIPFERYILLSGVDYPIKPNIEINSTFENNDSNYIDYFRLPGNCWKSSRGGLDRYELYHFNDCKILNPKSRNKSGLAVKKMLKYIGKVAPRKPPGTLCLYGGHQFWALTNSAINYLRTYIEKNKEVINFFKYTYAPDELFFHTILLNSDISDSIINDHMRFVLWSREDPAILNMDDSTRIAKSKALFARKFDSKKSIELISWLQNNVLKKDQI